MFVPSTGHDVVVMRDASGDLLPPRVPVSRTTSRALLTGLANVHDALEGKSDGGLCPIGARYAMFAPALHALGRGLPDAHPLADRIVQGWDLFAEHIDDDVASEVFAIRRDPERLGRRLACFSPTLLHGDPKLENLGLSPHGLVAIDWGDLAGLRTARGRRQVVRAQGRGSRRLRSGRDLRRLWRRGSTHGTRSARSRVHRLARHRWDSASPWAPSCPDRTRLEVAAEQLTWWTARVTAALERRASI